MINEEVIQSTKPIKYDRLGYNNIIISLRQLFNFLQEFSFIHKLHYHRTYC